VSRELSRPIVYLITTGECHAANFIESSKRILDIARAAVDAGVDLIQLREKQLSAKLLFELTQTVVAITRSSRTRLLVNDRLDIALAAGADGVHLTSSSMTAASVRPHVPDQFLVSVSCHSPADVAELEDASADVALFGPVFQSPGKGDGVGLESIRDICRMMRRIPILAVGGIDAGNYQSVLDAGAAGFAAIRALNDVKSKRRIMKELGR
jgi:thiamine-phosphate diphosphorylase